MKPGRSHRAGVTLVEMMTVVALIGLIIAVSFPAVSSGLESIRLNAATDTIVSFLNAGLNRADRRQQLIEIVVSLDRNELEMLSPEPGFTRKISMPEGVKIAKIYPEVQGTDERARSLVLYPGGSVPRFGLEIHNRRGNRRIVRIDPITGVPLIENPEHL